MAFLPIEKSTDEVTHWVVKCIECAKPVGTIEHTEIVSFLHYLTETGDVVLCFKCEEQWPVKKSWLNRLKDELRNDGLLV